MKYMLELDSWVVAEEDEFHWRFRDQSGSNWQPIILPKQGNSVEIPILNQIVYEITGWGMVGYFELRNRFAS